MDPFATLGLPRRYQLDVPQLEANYRELQRVLHPDRHAGASASQRRMNLLKAVEVNEAYRALKNDISRAEALLALRGGSERGGSERNSTPEDPEFLMEMLELREALGEANAAADRARVGALTARIEAALQAARTQLMTAFDALPPSPEASELAHAAKLLGRLKYFQRLRDEASAFDPDGEG